MKNHAIYIKSLDFSQVVKMRAALFLIFLMIGLSFLTSCSIFVDKKKDETSKGQGSTWSSVEGKPQWFRGIKQYQYKNSLGDVYSHPFYDLSPFLDYESLVINFFVLNTFESSDYYDFDINSGRRFLKYRLCDRTDAWKEYSGVVDTPNFTEGIVPRALDQLGRPLRIIVFGKEDFYKKEWGLISHQVKVVGALIRQYCSQVPCQEGIGFESQLVLVAVDQRDEKYRLVNNLQDLQQIVNWKYTKAYMENVDGVHFFENKTLPVYRIIREVNAKDAFVAATKKKLMIPGTELESMRKTCLSLYDLFWNSIGIYKMIEMKSQFKESMLADARIKKQIKDEQLTQEELEKAEKENKERIKNAYKHFVDSEADVDIQKKSTLSEKERRERAQTFKKNFISFYEKYGNEYGTCLKYVKYSDGTKNFYRHWFFAYTETFFRLIELGYLYDCDIQNWRDMGGEKNPMQHIVKQLKQCKIRRFDKAFPRALTYMTYIKQSLKRHYRYIEFDSNPGGTHEKIFSWVKDEGKKLMCIDPKENENIKRDSLFPYDIEWVSFYED